MLHAAVRKREIDIAKILVECGCPVDLQNVSEKSPRSVYFSGR